MNKLQDYVIAKDAKVIGKEYISDSVRGIFIGTKKYFFFIPVKAVIVKRQGNRTDQKKVDYTYKGEPIDQFIADYIATRGLSVADFEKFIKTKLKKAISEIQIIDLSQIAQYKVYVSWWGSGVLLNETTGKTGWTPFVSHFKGAKKEIRNFYKGQPKMVS